MAEIEETLRTYLLTKAALTALVGTRIFPDDVSDGAALPAVVYQKISDIKDHTLTGISPLESPMIQFSAYATTKASARAISNQIKAALSDYSGTMSGITIQYIKLVNEMSTAETSGDRTQKIYVDDLEFEVNFLRS